MKRFYQNAETGFHEDGFGVLLDGKWVKTPMMQRLALPTFAIAKKISDEFARQTEQIVPAEMPAMQFACSIQDRIATRADEVRAEILSYAMGDAICYWAGHPDSLLKREKSVWGGLLNMLEKQGLKFNICLGLNRMDQPPESAELIESYAANLDVWRLGIWVLVTNLTGSALAPYLWLRGEIDADRLYQAGFMPEIYRAEQAGDDPYQAPHLSPKHQSIMDYADMLAALNGGGDFARAHVFAHGRVQGVGYRAFVLNAVKQLSIGGFVRNRADGSVEVELRGAPADVNDVLRKLCKGPILAKVDHIAVHDFAPCDTDSSPVFEKKPTL